MAKITSSAEIISTGSDFTISEIREFIESVSTWPPDTRVVVTKTAGLGQREQGYSTIKVTTTSPLSTVKPKLNPRSQGEK